MKKPVFLTCALLTMLCIAVFALSGGAALGEEDHEHYAVCTDPYVCAMCGMTTAEGAEINYVEHNFDWLEYQYDANQHWNVCADCGAVINPDYHWAVCTDPETCATCGMTTAQGAGIGQPSHNYQYQYDASRHWSVCQDCGDIVNEDYHWAFCTNPEACASCGMTTAQGAEISNLNHNCDWSHYQQDASQHWIACTDCGEIIAQGNHLATCINPDTCYECGMTTAQGAVMGEIIHNFDIIRYESDENSHWLACANCSAENGAHTNHSSICTNPDTCTVCGMTTAQGAKIARCNHTGDRTTEYDANQHWFICSGCGEALSTSPHSTKCTSPDACSVCGMTTAQGAVINRIYHNYYGVEMEYDAGTHWTVCPDCGEELDRYTHFAYCTDPDVCGQCGMTTAQGAIITEIQHNPASGPNYQGSKFGYDTTQHWKICPDCGEIYGLGTHYSLCFNPDTCYVCGMTTEQGAVIASIDHIGYVKYEYDANQHWEVCSDCVIETNRGNHTASCTNPDSCSVCGMTRAQGAVIELQHGKEEDAAAVAPTCTETGLTAGTKCSVCGEILKAQETVAALGHTEEALAAVTPTCTETGLTAGTKCSVCGEILKAQETVAALGHTEEALAAVTPTCTETGLTAGTKCSVCGEILKAQETVAALGHTEETLAAVAPTCTETGLTAGTKCSVCSEILKAQETVAALGHDYVDGVCAVCGAADPNTGLNSDPDNEPDSTQVVKTEEEIAFEVMEAIADNEVLSQSEAMKDAAVEVRTDESGEQVVAVAVVAQAEDGVDTETATITLETETLAQLEVLEVDEIKVTNASGNVTVTLDVAELASITKETDSAKLIVKIDEMEQLDETTAEKLSENYEIVGEPLLVQVILVAEDNTEIILTESEKLIIHLEIEKTDENTVILFIDPTGRTVITESEWVEEADGIPAHWEVPYLGEGRYLPVVVKE